MIGMGNVIRIVSISLLVLAGGGTLLAQTGSRGGAEVVLATSETETGAIRLGADPTHIPLSKGALADIAKRIRGGGRVDLVLDRVRAAKPPGFIFLVFLDATDDGRSPAGGSQPVGTFNLYELNQPELRYDVTERIEQLAAADSRRQLIVTVKPDLGRVPPAPAQLNDVGKQLEQANVTVAEARLVAN